MRVNPIEELRHMEAPVSEQEWASIVNDSRYMQKFGKKPNISPKGRAALVAGIAAVLITVPILVITLSHKETTTSPTTPTPVETSVQQTTKSTVSQTVSPQTIATPSTPNAPETRTTNEPTKVAVTDQSANNERATMVDVIAKRQQTATNQATNETVPQTAPKQPTTRDNSKPTQTEQVITANNNTKPAPSRPSKSTSTNDDNDDAQMALEEESQRSNPTEEEPVPADEFYIPSAFTPNGDGLNDIFYVNANFEPKNYEIYIYNRGGELMFTARDMRIGWDGKLHGHTLAHGVYVYLIKYKDRDGNEKREQGQVLLIP